jgi:hypothetical protein
MAYDQLSEFPRGHWSGDLTSDPTNLGTDGQTYDIAWIMLSNTGAATDDITITQQGGTDFSFIVAIPPDGTVIVPAFRTSDGIRLTGGAAAIKYWVAYYNA